MSSDNIAVQYENEYLQVEKVLNTNALQSIWADLKLKKEVSFIFMSDEELIEINKTVLNHDYYTDVITFDYSDDDDIEYNEILISVDRIKDHAAQLNISLKEEVHRVCIHGMLHLAGHEDYHPKEKEEMTKLENHYLQNYCST